MDRQINFKQLAIALLIAMSPTLFVVWSNSKSEIKKTIIKHELILENHTLKIQVLERNDEKVLSKLDEINKNIVSLMLGMKDKQDRK